MRKENMQTLGKGGWRKKAKKMLAGVLAGAMVLTSGIVTPQNMKTSEAAAEGTETIVGTGWWNEDNQRSSEYTLTGNGELTFYVGIEEAWMWSNTWDENGYSAFSVWIHDSERYIMMDSQWGITGWLIESDFEGDLEGDVEGLPGRPIVGHLYRITITRDGTDFTMEYFDVTANKEYHTFKATNTNMDESVDVYAEAQAGTFIVGASEFTFTGIIGSVGTSTEDESLDWADYAPFCPLAAEAGDFEASYEFHNISAGVYNWKNYAIALSPDSNPNPWLDSATDWYLRADNWSNGPDPTVGDIAFGNSTVTYSSNINWDEFTNTMKDAAVSVSISRKGTTISISSVVMGANGISWTYTATVTDGPTGALNIYLGGEDCLLKVYNATLNQTTHSLTIKYEDEQGKELAPSETIKVGEGEYSFIPKEIANYKAVEDKITVTVTKDTDVTVVYKEGNSVVIHYVYEDGTTAAPDENIDWIDKGQSYSVNSPELNGYIADQLVVSGIMGNEKVEVTVTYTKVPQASEEPAAPTAEPSTEPTEAPAEPTVEPSTEPTETPATPTVEPSTEPTADPTTTPSESPTPTKAPTVSKGDTVTASNATYKVTSTKDKSVTYTDTSTKNSKKTSVTVPKTVKVTSGGKQVTYKVTTVAKGAFKNNDNVKKITIGENITKIGANAFKGCDNLTTIVINSKKLTSVGSNALKGTSKKLVIKVPAKKLNAYKKLFSGKGNNSVTIKKA